MKRILFIALFLPQIICAQQATGEVIGEVVDSSGYPVFDARVFIDDMFGQRYQARTDVDGRFRISMVPIGEYSLNICQFGDTLAGIRVDVPRDGFYNCETLVFQTDVYICVCPPMDVPVPVDLFGHTHFELDAEKIRQSVDRFHLEKLISGNSSAIQLLNTSNELSSRGARSGDYLQLIDEIKVRGDVQLPSTAYNTITVYTNGIPAKFGDTTGGVIEIETIGYFDLYRQWKNEQLKVGR